MGENAIYQRPDGSIEVKLEKDTVWLSLMQMSRLFGRHKSVMSRHLRNVFAAGELEASLSLLVAESRPADKDVLIRLIMNMLAGEGA
jgi:hypothetical protein